MRQSITTKLRSAAGVSFAEMLACTVLFSLAFMVGVSGLLFAFHSTEQVMQAADAQTVSDAILNRIDGEIAGVVSQDSVMMDNGGVNATIVGFTGSSGIPVYICSKSVSGHTEVGDTTHDKELLIYYRATTTNDATGNETKIPESYWTFDKTAYQGYKITDLNFTQGKHHDNLTVTTSLTLESPTGKKYTTSRTVCCYNRTAGEVKSETVANIITPLPDDPANSQQQASDFEEAVKQWLEKSPTGKFTSEAGDYSKGKFYKDYYSTHSAAQMPDEYRNKLIKAGLLSTLASKTLYWWSYPVTDGSGKLLYIATFANEYNNSDYWWNGTVSDRTSIGKGYVVLVEGVTYLRKASDDVQPGNSTCPYQTEEALVKRMMEFSAEPSYTIFTG